MYSYSQADLANLWAALRRENNPIEASGNAQTIKFPSGTGELSRLDGRYQITHY